MKLKGLIAAAGRSSRMDGFKPLMKLNGFPMIQMTVQSLRDGGIEEITVVTGCQARRMEEVLRPLKVSVVENRAYQKTDMLDSIRLGLSGLTDADAVFFLPGDVPLVSPKSIRRLKETLFTVSSDVLALCPVTGGYPAHPPVLLAGSYEHILHWQGEGGLKGALSALRPEQVELEDEGALADADYRSDFERLHLYARKHKGISEALCEELYEEADLPEHIRAHCRAVGMLAGKMAETLVSHGVCLDTQLCRSGGFVHDLCRLSDHHEIAAGAFLQARGYDALAEIARRHKGFSGTEPTTVCREWVLVCLADKLIKETRRTTLEERYQKAFQHTAVKERILRDIRIMKRLIEEFEVITGEKL